MKTYLLVGAVLIGLGALGLTYRHFSFTKETHDAKIGPIELSVQEKQHVTVPDWAAWSAIVGGVSVAAFGVLLKPAA